jgi:hypothetical protein
MNMMTSRQSLIVAAYESAIAGRDPDDVDIKELWSDIAAAVPDANRMEIAAAIRASAQTQMAEADQLQRYSNAKFTKEQA